MAPGPSDAAPKSASPLLPDSSVAMTSAIVCTTTRGSEEPAHRDTLSAWGSRQVLDALVQRRRKCRFLSQKRPQRTRPTSIHQQAVRAYACSSARIVSPALAIAMTALPRLTLPPHGNSPGAPGACRLPRGSLWQCSAATRLSEGDFSWRPPLIVRAIFGELYNKSGAVSSCFEVLICLCTKIAGPCVCLCLPLFCKGRGIEFNAPLQGAPYPIGVVGVSESQEGQLKNGFRILRSVAKSSRPVAAHRPARSNLQPAYKPCRHEPRGVVPTEQHHYVRFLLPRMA